MGGRTAPVGRLSQARSRPRRLACCAAFRNPRTQIDKKIKLDLQLLLSHCLSTHTPLHRSHAQKPESQYWKRLLLQAFPQKPPV